MESIESVEQRIDKLVKLFTNIKDWEARYKHIIRMGQSLKMDESLKIDSNKVRGCQSQVWLHASLNSDNRIVFQGDSDAAIVRGIVAVLLSVYSNAAPDEILQTNPNFLDRIGLKDHLSMSRANGLAAMLKQITFYAMAFKAKIGS